MSFFSIFEKMAELFAVIIVGFVANKTGIMNGESNKLLSKVVVNVCLPFYIISSVTTSTSLPSNGEIVDMLLVALLCSAIQLAAAFVFPRLLGLKKGEGGVYSFMLAFGNVGFIGYPAVSAIFGSQAIFINAVLNLPFNILVYTLGVRFLAKGDGGKLQLKALLTPALLASVLAIALSFIKPAVPTAINDSMSLIGQVTTPAALLIIGSMLAQMPIKEMLGGWRIYAVSFIRLLAVPLVLMLILKTFVTDPVVLGCTVVICGMPVAANGTMLCLEYGADPKVMTQATFVTTALSIVTISVLAMIVS